MGGWIHFWLAFTGILPDLLTNGKYWESYHEDFFFLINIGHFCNSIIESESEEDLYEIKFYHDEDAIGIE
tara:strand:- start:496 stop:705 length:210 start_codon:yes stop_codon:yes gene_type:complete